jgi:uncharacterized protein (TIGR04222 family)
MFSEIWSDLCGFWNTASDGERLGTAAAVIVLQFVAARWLRRLLRWPYLQPTDAVRLSPYELAYFVGGAERVFQVALGNLLRRGVAVLHVQNNCSDSMLTVEAPLAAGTAAVEREVYEAIAAQPGRSVEQTFKPGTLEPRFAEQVLRQSPGALAIHGRLADARLVLSGAQLDAACDVPLGLSVASVIGLMIGVIKLSESGGERRLDGVAAGILVALTLALIAALAGLGQCHQTVRGERLCQKLRRELAAAQGVIAANPIERLTDEEFVTFAAVGSTWLWQQPPLAELQVALRPPPSEPSGD